MGYTLAGIVKGSGSCEHDNCGRALRRLFLVREDSGQELTVGRRCAAKLTGWNPNSLERQLEMQAIQALHAERRRTVMEEFPQAESILHPYALSVCITEDAFWGAAPNYGRFKTWRDFLTSELEGR